MHHRDLERRSLMMHRIIADRLRANPELIRIARANLARWNCPERGWWREWMAILEENDVAGVAELLERDDEEGCRLRQSSPFAGILSPQEVWELKRDFVQNDAAA